MTLPLTIHDPQRAIGRGYSRREVLRRLAAGVCAATASAGWIMLAAQAATSGKRHKSCILLWMDGGAEPQGHVRPEAGHRTRRRAQADRHHRAGHPDQRALPAVRPADAPRGHHPQHEHAENDHVRARYHMHTGYREARRRPGVSEPGLDRGPGAGQRRFPAAELRVSMDGGGRTYGTASGFLGRAHQPLLVKNATRGVENSRSAVSTEAFERRVDLLDSRRAAASSSSTPRRPASPTPRPSSGPST